LANEKSKFINLILTRKGERVANPNFGCDLWRLLFEQKDDEIQDKAQQYVIEAVDAFMPYLVLQEIQVLNLDTFGFCEWSQKQGYTSVDFERYGKAAHPGADGHKAFAHEILIPRLKELKFI